ncbi:MAG TPA: hypothetical protein VGL58_14150 [Caulobacteraceae bacterium]|jgi:hypothetical protein
MKWYAAHVVIALFADDRSGPVEAFENIYLVAGKTPAAARKRAEELGRAEETLDDGLTIDGAPGRCAYLGVRKLVSISNAAGSQDEAPPSDGSEITYSRWKFATVGEAVAFAQGDQASLTAIE